MRHPCALQVTSLGSTLWAASGTREPCQQPFHSGRHASVGGRALTAFTLELKHALSAIGKPCPRPPEVPWGPLLLPASQSFQVLPEERSALPARLITLGGLGVRRGGGDCHSETQPPDSRDGEA